jgi:hypothetical protein
MHLHIFWDAGASIIQDTMKNGDFISTNSDVAGKVVQAFYGFCDIRNFTDCTEASEDIGRAII